MNAINMCNGERSWQEVNNVIQLLENAFIIHSGLQQAQGHISNEELEEGKEEIYNIIETIKASLGYPDNMPTKYKTK
ncbi:MAG: hypothetical protein WC979_02185 [Candidatus Pacearchaeota archaeon]|jgi:hypothetical protein|nr:hypothetical protein [Clostridia bacterium]